MVLDNSVSPDPGLPTIELAGFYITPFEKKSYGFGGQGAVTRVEKEVDFEEVAKTVIDAIGSARHTTSTAVYKFRLERHVVKAKYLDESIMKNIDEANFIIVDWTTMNPNVLLEASYARGRSKHGIHMSADGSFPSDRAGIIYQAYDPLNLANLGPALSMHIPALIDRVESGPWVFDYYAARSTDLVRRMIHESQNEICILQTNLETVNTNHLPDLADALKRNVKVRILTLDPQSRYVNERALQLDYKNETIKVYRNGLQVAIENTTAQLANRPGFRMRLYNDFPNQLTYIFDNHVLASVISRTGRSRDNCVFHLPTHRLVGAKHTFIDHFNQLWDSAGQEIGFNSDRRETDDRETKVATASKGARAGL